MARLKASDVDVFIELSRDISLNASKNIPGFIHPAKLMQKYPSLVRWSEKWSKLLVEKLPQGHLSQERLLI